jgi:hypothetical protein
MKFRIAEESCELLEPHRWPNSYPLRDLLHFIVCPISVIHEAAFRANLEIAWMILTCIRRGYAGLPPLTTVH